jgi:DNA-binding response OmpR family regulator
VSVAGGKGPIVLVVDDEPAIRLLCRVNLELDGFDVREAATLAEARAAIEAEIPAVILLDMHVGRERGATLLAEIRLREPRIAVARVSGSVEMQLGAGAAGADAIIVKPFTLDELTGTVRALAAGHEPR